MQRLGMLVTIACLMFITQRKAFKSYSINGTIGQMHASALIQLENPTWPMSLLISSIRNKLLSKNPGLLPFPVLYQYQISKWSEQTYRQTSMSMITSPRKEIHPRQMMQCPAFSKDSQRVRGSSYSLSTSLYRVLELSNRMSIFPDLMEYKVGKRAGGRDVFFCIFPNSGMTSKFSGQELSSLMISRPDTLNQLSLPTCLFHPLSVYILLNLGQSCLASDCFSLSLVGKKSKSPGLSQNDC